MLSLMGMGVGEWVGCRVYELHAELRCFVIWLGKGGVGVGLGWEGDCGCGCGWGWVGRAVEWEGG